jgi:hypothetical protein
VIAGAGGSSELAQRQRSSRLAVGCSGHGHVGRGLALCTACARHTVDFADPIVAVLALGPLLESAPSRPRYQGASYPSVPPPVRGGRGQCMDPSDAPRGARAAGQGPDPSWLLPVLAHRRDGAWNLRWHAAACRAMEGQLCAAWGGGGTWASWHASFTASAAARTSPPAPLLRCVYGGGNAELWPPPRQHGLLLRSTIDWDDVGHQGAACLLVPACAGCTATC